MREDFITTYHAQNALARVLDTINLEEEIRVPLENQFKWELRFEVSGEPPEAEED